MRLPSPYRAVRWTWRLWALIAVALVASQWTFEFSALGGPICFGPDPSLSFNLSQHDLVIIAKFVEARKGKNDRDTTTTFEVVEVLKGNSDIVKGLRFDWKCEFESRDDPTYILFGDTSAESGEIADWMTATHAPLEVQAYAREMLTLLKESAQRLAFCLRHAEHPENEIRFDATSHLEGASWSERVELKPYLDREQLWKWIDDPAVVEYHRGIYLKLLAVCGTTDDLPKLENLLRTKGKKSSAASAMIAYVALRGEAGLVLIDELYLKRAKPEDFTAFYHACQALAALRELPENVKGVPKARIAQSLRLGLDAPELADLVIPELANLEDWESLERLVQLFRDADPKTTFVQIPIVAFVSKCPLPRAADALKELERISPESVERANRILNLRSKPMPVAK